MEGDYVNRHVEFVSGHNGTTVQELFWLTGLGPISILLRNLAIPWMFPAKNFATGRPADSVIKLILDFCFVILPTVLAYTYFSDRLLYILLAQGLLAIALFTFCICEYLYLYRDKPRFSEVLLERCENRRPFYITYLRSYTLICTAVAILAVDFGVFPRRFAKTETYGYSLMDSGVGVYVIINALTAPELRKQPLRLTRRILSTLPLIIMGFVRLLFVKLSGYHEHVTEYGVHWNFFFTIAAVKILSSIISEFVSIWRFSALLALLLGVSYECLLQRFDLKSLLLYGVGGTDEREDIFDANREGLISVSGYLMLYFAGLQLGAFLQRPRTRLKTWALLLVQLLTLCLLSYGILIVCQEILGPASRRMANLTYCVWIIFTVLFPITCFLAIEVLALFGSALQLPLFSVGVSPFDQLEPCLLNRINRRGLFYFLMANLMTGMVNFLIKTIELDNELSTFFVVTYVFGLSVIISIF